MNKIKKLFTNDYFIKEADNGKKANPWYLELVFFVMVFSIASLFQSVIMFIPMCYYFLEDKQFMDTFNNGPNNIVDSDYLNEIINGFPEGYNIWMLFSNIALIAIVVVYCKYFEKRSFSSMGFHKKRGFIEYLCGYLSGLLCMSAVVVICILTNSVNFYKIPKVSGIVIILMFFLGYLVQGFAEEVLCRSYLMVSIAKRYGMTAGIIINSLVFAALHLMNPGITILAFVNLFAFGVLASVYMIKRKSIWAPAAFHSAWNFAQGNIFGISVSGLKKQTSIFATDSIKEHTIINGGSFGAEGGIAVTFVFFVFILIIFFIDYRKTNNDNQGGEINE